MLREFFTPDVFTGILLLNMLFIVIAKHLYNARFDYFLEINWNVRYLKLYAKEPKKSDLFNILLLFNFILGLGVLVHIVYSKMVVPLPNNITTLFKLCLVFGLVIVFKIVLESVVAHFFKITELVKIYIFQKLTHLNFSGLLLIVINLLLLFSPVKQTLIISIGFGLVLLIKAIGFVRIFRLYQKKIIDNFFYFLLYLCALEIGPYIILYKAINDYFG